MKSFNFFHNKEEHGRDSGDSGSEWDDVANYGEFEDQEPSAATEEQIVKGTEEAERNAEKYNDASEIGGDYARSIIEQIKSGKMTREEGKAIYEKLKKEEDQYQQEVQNDINERMRTEKQHEADRKKDLLEKINQHPVARKVVSGILAAGIVAGGFAISKRIMGSRDREVFSTATYAEGYDDGNSSIGDIGDNAGDEQRNSFKDGAEETADGAGENASDEFETMANGVTYSKDAYSDERRDKKNDFTNEFQDVYGDEMGTKEAIINAVTKDPIYLVAVFSKLPDEMKGNYAGMSDTVLANAINGVAGAEVQEFMLDAVKNAVEAGDVDFVTSAGGEIAHIEYEIRDKGEESNPSNVRLAYREATILEGDKSTKLTLSDGSEVVFDDTCGNIWILVRSSSMEQDGHVEIVEDDEDPTPEDPTPEDPTPEDPTPEDPTPEDPTPEDPTPEDPTPEDPTPEDPTPEDPTPEDPTPEDPTPEDPTPEDPTPEDPTPEDPTPEDPTPEDHNDAKDPEQIEQNMQVHDESTNIITPMDAGELSDRPVTDDEDNQYDEGTNTFGDVIPDDGTGDKDGDGVVDSGNTQTGAQDTDLESADGSGNTIAENVEQADTSTVTDDGEKVADQENRTEEDKAKKQADEEAKVAQEQTNKEQEAGQQEAAQREDAHAQQQDIIDTGNADDATDEEKEAARKAEEAQAREREEVMREIYRDAGYTDEEIDAMFGRS